MPHKYVSSTMFTTPMGVVRWVRLQLKSIEKLSHETAPPVITRIFVLLPTPIETYRATS